MSRQLIALNPDLRQLQNEGYDLDVRGGFLVIRDVPYVTSGRSVQLGHLISKLEMSGERTNKPSDHVAYWTGEHPCHSDGSKISSFENPSAAQDFGGGVRADFTFSAKAAYRDYHHKMTTYIARIAGEAAKVDSSSTAQTFPAIPEDGEDSVFKYTDTASSRSGIGALNAKLAGQKVAIVGLGGTGSYVLDLVAKTVVAEIHLFDADVFSQHNAFRAPGAATLEELRQRSSKVSYFAMKYAAIRNRIIPHEIYLDEKSVSLLDGFDFVFLCMDRGAIKRDIVERLTATNTEFVDVGMGLVRGDGELAGVVRVTSSTTATRVQAAPHISYSDETTAANDYSTNIQIVELNALNAALAVVRWKKHLGFYRSAHTEYYCGYSTAAGAIVTEYL